jgi:hypothetical protein
MLLLFSLFLVACGTLDVGIEGTPGPAGQAGATAAALATENARLSAEVTRLAEAPALSPTTPISASLPLSLSVIVSREVGPNESEPQVVVVATVQPEVQGVTGAESPPTAGTVTIIGTAARLDFPSGWTELVPDAETPFANADGIVKVQISEWARIRDAEGSVADREALSKGARLEVTASLQDDLLIAEEVVVLSPGVPRPEDNPAYTDVTGLVTPIAEPPAQGGVIQLFEASSEFSIVDPGALVTLRWAFEGASGAICERITPRPLSDTCYQDLPSSGSLQVTVPADARGAIGYFLYVQADEQVAEEMVILPLSAERGCSYDWFFGTAEYPFQPLLECPTSEPTQIRPQVQRFEKGLMLRLQGVEPDGEAWLVTLVPHEDGGYSLGFEPVVDSWSPGMPETDPALAPPDGLFQPSRGFGMLWRGEIEHQPMGEPQTLDGEELLGWATGSVFEYDAVYQCFQGTHGRALACFMNGPDGDILPMPLNP